MEPVELTSTPTTPERGHVRPPLSAGARAKAGIAAGDEVAVTITPQAARPAD